MKRLLVLVVVGLWCLTPVPLLASEPASAAKAPPDKGDTAWMLVSTGLVLFMVPGLALFYGGMARRKNLLGTMMHSMVTLSLVGIQWLLFGYCLAFGASQGGWIGWSPDLLGLQGVLPNQPFASSTIPIYVHCMYQGMFAIITPALISGAIAERVRFGPYCLFVLLWSTLIYAPLAHWVWAVNDRGEPVGWLGAMGALDFAGGTVVHVAAGVSGLAAILVLRKRLGYPEHALHPSSMVLTLLGAGMLWFGWFGFNGGSGLASGAHAAAALTATQMGAAGGALAWMLAEWLHKGKATALGFASGLVAGLVAVTPASGFVRPTDSLWIGLISGLVCYGAVTLKPKLKYDDSLDAFGVHGVGGFLGAILTGVFASSTLFVAASGAELPPAKLGESPAPRVLVQLVAALSAAGYAFVGTLILVKCIDRTVGFCLEPRQENEGLDRSMHGELAIDLGPSLDVPVESTAQPRPALVPPGGSQRFTIVVEGSDNGDLMHVWSEMCQAGTTPRPEFKAVYPYLTTVQGNRFRFRGGDPLQIAENLQRLFETSLNGRGQRILARVET